MKQVFMIAIITSLPFPWAGAVDFNPPFCVKEILAELNSFGAVNNQGWKTEMRVEGEPQTFKSPTNTFGRWVQMSVSPQRVEMKVFENSRYVSKTWQKNICKKPGTIKKQIVSSSKKMLGDKKLMKEIKKRGRGIVYIWSPGMVYSVKFSSRFKEAAKKLALSFLPVMDPKANEVVAARVLASNQNRLSTKKLNSVELIMRGATNHYPTTFVYKDGRIQDRPIVGVMTLEKLENEIIRRLLD